MKPHTNLTNDGNVSNAVCEHVNIVTGGHGDSDFELARQVRRAVQWLVVYVAAHRFLVQPDFVVGRRLGLKVGVDLIRKVVNLLVDVRVVDLTASPSVGLSRS